ncbi:MAG TPA: TIGR03618 family F420-dependent PPOX class oxidoreductase [Pseudonocardia sp.]|uniref:TIGR03618 family F420-dependent PPOX class oxidoreductase n=1 Tax=Pseudonocardia sp. TaxID=60912 RepID=UPI002C91EC63|nr:TIGR03618 family F420-dependent PPOX class oxidoreductase [Pseudonocardia sp.]HTF53966.1 TIGR03618 family F420-dependent PPOX class oxidoreductase [Pseudonocardia sp.]
MSSNGRSFVISGGTDGIGGALALAYLERGDEVAVIGRNAEKGKAFLDAAATLGAAGRAHFVLADLSLVSETRAAIAEISGIFARLDGLVLCARHYRSTRLVTAEGFEHTFALYYLSRFVLSYGLVDLLDAADQPIILNVSGPGSGTGEIRWDDLGGERDFHAPRILAQGGQLNDLLGIGFVLNRPSEKVRYALLHPGVVNTSFSGEYDPETAAHIEALRATAQPIDQALPPIFAVLDNPPAEPLSATVIGQPISVRGPAFDETAARRLYAETTTLLSRVAPAAPGVSVARLHRVLDAPIFATVATVQPDGSPHQSVVWVARDGDDVLFVVAVGSRKERNLRRDPRVSVLVSPPEEPYSYAAIQGTASLRAEGSRELRDALALRYTGLSYAEHNIEAAARYGEIEITTVRVTPERIVGRLR